MDEKASELCPCHEIARKGGSLLGNTLPLGLLCHTADELLWVGGLTMLKIHFHSTFSYVSSFHPGQNSY